eukprot:TRINITY_DN3170_c0_g1_i1.p1 TRINITY_DN3170_c0_g1~~TRINITY_DN3170_c0_g1_i1.p1  ORF type:complete len:266 (+),score=140.42 TRINITY_DN3170_c0_g1_i1:112-798(+)
MPTTINGEILDIELSNLLTEDIRKRHKKTVGHLALGTQFTFVEVDVNHFLSEGTKLYCHDKMEERRVGRELRKSKDEQERKRREHLGLFSVVDEMEMYKGFEEGRMVTLPGDKNWSEEFVPLVEEGTDKKKEGGEKNKGLGGGNNNEGRRRNERGEVLPSFAEVAKGEVALPLSMVFPDLEGGLGGGNRGGRGGKGMKGAGGGGLKGKKGKKQKFTLLSSSNSGRAYK